MVLRFSILAAAFLLSCTGIERDSVCDEKSIKYNGCAGGVSPSSNSGSYTSKGNNIANYNIVQIGDQVWMAENLDYDVSGSVCYQNSEDFCKKYGRLYDWFTAIKVCPLGWHLPGNGDWQKLVDFAGGNRIAGADLSALTGWEGGGGQDKYGFSALPGGEGLSGGSFGNAGGRSYWWSSNDRDSYYAYYWEIYGANDVRNEVDNKGSLFSVRCLRSD